MSVLLWKMFGCHLEVHGDPRARFRLLPVGVSVATCRSVARSLSCRSVSGFLRGCTGFMVYSTVGSRREALVMWEPLLQAVLAHVPKGKTLDVGPDWMWWFEV